MGIQPPKLSKFRNLAINLYLRGDSFAIFYEIHQPFLRKFSFVLVLFLFELLLFCCISLRKINQFERILFYKIADEMLILNVQNNLCFN